jgi:trimeric autotransporter adhesin
MREFSPALLSLLVSALAAAQTYSIATFAGGGLPASAPATAVNLGQVTGVAVDAAGNVFIASGQYDIVFRLDAQTRLLTVAAGTGTIGFSGDNGPAAGAQLSIANAPFGQYLPTGIAVDSAGNLYIADAFRVRKVSDGVITTIAGTGTFGFSGDNGPAANAQMGGSLGLALDSAGNLYISDSDNNRIRKISNGVITTIAGKDGLGAASGDNGPAINAQLYHPRGLAVDTSGNLYIADSVNNRVRKIANGVITTVVGNGTCGSGGYNGPATAAVICQVWAVAVDSAGNLYTADSVDQRIRKISNGLITTVAGTDSPGFSGDGGPATTAGLGDPTGIAVDSAGNLYVADESNNRIRKIANGVITTVAGGGSPIGGSSYGDGGPATSAQLSNPSLPTGIAVDPSGSVYITDSLRVRKVSGGIITTVAGNGTQGSSGDGGPASSAQLIAATGVAVDSASNVYIVDANRIRKISNSVIATIAGGGGDPGGGSVPALNAAFVGPSGVAVDTPGNVFVADNFRVQEVSNGAMTTVAGNGTPGSRTATPARPPAPSS